MHVRVCRQCDEEYRPEIAVCADCGAELVDADDEGAPASAAAGHAATEGVEPEQPLYAAGSPRDLTALADELVRAGLPFRLASAAERDPDRRGYDLRVPLSAVEAAQRVLAPLVAADLGRLYVEIPVLVGLPEVDDEAEPLSSCPACETPLAEEALECPACGLAVGPVDEQ
jgi:hypothetical protein